MISINWLKPSKEKSSSGIYDFNKIQSTVPWPIINYIKICFEMIYSDG